MSVIINKGIKGHNALNVIDKILEIRNIPQEVPILQHKQSYGLHAWTTEFKKEYHKKYSKMKFTATGKRMFGLKIKNFKNRNGYIKAYKEQCKFADDEELKHMIKEQLNGGFAYDECCVMI